MSLPSRTVRALNSVYWAIEWKFILTSKAARRNRIDRLHDNRLSQSHQQHRRKKLLNARTTTTTIDFAIRFYVHARSPGIKSTCTSCRLIFLLLAPPPQRELRNVLMIIIIFINKLFMLFAVRIGPDPFGSGWKRVRNKRRKWKSVLWFGVAAVRFTG